VATISAMWPLVASTASPAAGEESGKERMELCHPILGYIDDDLLIIRRWC
jgi:hypothetical protein